MKESTTMWYENNFRRIFLDMHINDDNEIYLSNLDPVSIVNLLKEAGAQQIVVKSRPHTGLANYPTKIGRMHRGLKGRDYMKEMVDLCHAEGIAVQAYFSQMFDNWAYDNYPEWRMVNIEGKNSLEYCDYTNHSMFRRGRYGLVCPNNMEYRAYVKECLNELTIYYEFESIFLDMPFWPEICYCASCRERYFNETGLEMPLFIDLENDSFKRFVSIREQWMGEFAQFASDCVKSVRPLVTIEHNMSCSSAPWQFATTNLVADACDYVGGDLYGGYLEQTFVCKYFRNLTKVLPFVFISSRCDPGLSAHTTSKTQEELILHSIISLVHNGAFSICDGMNPDGTVNVDVYKGIIRNAFLATKPYEKYVSGEMITNISIMFPDRAKYDWKENGLSVGDTIPFHDSLTNDFCKNPLDLAKIMREENIPFDVFPACKLNEVKDEVVAICEVANLREDEMEALEKYIKNGGNVYLSGRPGHKRILELLQATYEGETEHTVTYMRPTPDGAEYFESFSESSPMNVKHSQSKMRFTGDYQVLAKLTLPYTMTGTRDYASIHSDPPGISTDYPSVVLKKIGQGSILWVSAPIEASRPHHSRRVVGRLLRSLCGEVKIKSNAPAFVEILGWAKGQYKYYAAINQQEYSPIAPIYNIEIELPYKVKSAIGLDTGEAITLTNRENTATMLLPKLDIFQIIQVEEL